MPRPQIPTKRPTTTKPKKSFTIQPWDGSKAGEKILLDGNTGMGKTTLSAMAPATAAIGPTPAQRAASAISLTSEGASSSTGKGSRVVANRGCDSMYFSRAARHRWVAASAFAFRLHLALMSRSVSLTTTEKETKSLSLTQCLYVLGSYIP